MIKTSILENEKGCVAAGLNGKEMRLSMENKNLLSSMGSMYFGTGKTKSDGDVTFPLIKAVRTQALEEVADGDNIVVGISFSIADDVIEADFKKIQEKIASLRCGNNVICSNNLVVKQDLEG